MPEQYYIAIIFIRCLFQKFQCKPDLIIMAVRGEYPVPVGVDKSRLFGK